MIKAPFIIKASFMMLSDGKHMAIRRPAPAAEGVIERRAERVAESTEVVRWEIVEVDQEVIEKIQAAVDRVAQKRLRELSGREAGEGEQP